MIQRVNDRYPDGDNYLKYSIKKTLSYYDDDVAHYLQEMVEKLSVQIEDLTFLRKAHRRQRSTY